jgi:hypothetical protein
LKVKEKDYCVKAAFYNVISKSRYYHHNQKGGISINTNTNTTNKNKKPCDCAYCKSQRQIRDLQYRQYRKPLDDIERQLEESRKKREDYEKTVRLLRLVNKDPISS